MKFMFDEHMPPRLVRSLVELTRDEPYSIIHLRDRFPPGTLDIEWIIELSNEGGWAFVSEDRRIRRRPHELDALKRSKLVGAFLAKGWNQEELLSRASLLILWWPIIVDAVSGAKPGQMFEVPHSRKVTSLKPLR